LWLFLFYSSGIKRHYDAVGSFCASIKLLYETATLLAVFVQVLSCYTDFVSTDTYSGSTKLLCWTLPAISVLIGLLVFTKSFGLVFNP